MATEDNLKAAFAGESQANRKYTAFSRKAEQEGFKQVAKLFRVAAESETVHALNHLNVLREVKSTKENLEVAISGETYENSEMYPKFIKEAEKENNQAAVISFSGANATEKMHASYYKKALESVDTGKDLEPEEYFVCQVCGYTADGEAPDNCPICNAPKEKFKRIE